jgi:CBS-domain-containing membrane protein
MTRETKPLLELTAADLMTASVVVVSEEMSLKAAAHLLTQATVTGAPVVSAKGQCVGVLSASDFLHWMDRDQGGPAACAASPAFCTLQEMTADETKSEPTVRDYMTRNPVTAAAPTRIGQLARNMIDVHIHRVIVVDSCGKPIGIVSSTDLLAALAKADLTRASRGHAAPSLTGAP